MARITVSEGQNIQVHSGHEPMQAMCFRNTVSVSNALSPHGENSASQRRRIAARSAPFLPVILRSRTAPCLFRRPATAKSYSESSRARRTSAAARTGDVLRASRSRRNLRSSTPRARRLTDAEELKPAPIGESAASAGPAREARRGPSAIDEHARDMVAAGDPRSALRRRQPHDKAPPESSAARRAGYRRVKVSYPVA